MFFWLEKKNSNNKSQTYNIAYLARFTNSMRLLIATLDTHVNNLLRKLQLKVHTWLEMYGL